MSKILEVLAVLLLALWWAHPTSATAHLLASKSILNEHVAEGKDLTVMYSIYNVGSSPAQSIVLDDSSFHPEDFTLVQGLLSASWDRIPHNTNVTHTVILRPLSFGLYNISWARISYTSSDNGQEIVGFTSAPGFIKVISFPEFSRMHESHVMEWLAFVAMSTPTIVLPLLLWYRSFAKYEKLKTKRE